MKRHFAVVISFGLLLALSVPVFAELADGVWIHYSGCLRGSVDPCGCKIPAGGIAKRIGEIATMQKVAGSDLHFYVDAGEWRDLADPVDGNARTAALLASMKVGPLAAVNVSLRDLMLGRKLLDSLAFSDSIPFVSANLRIDSNNAPLYPPYRFGTGNLRGKSIKVAFVGLTDPSYTRISNQREGIIALDWNLLLKDILTDLKSQKADAIILLTDAAPKRLDSLLAGLTGFQLVISSSPVWQMMKINERPYGYVVTAVPQGKNWEAVKFQETGLLPWLYTGRELTSNVPEQPVVAQLITDRKKAFVRQPVKLPDTDSLKATTLKPAGK
ncbi:MAG: hypothetical protein OEM52_01010 [bacterium]|nr:hypothetical protein [bacterium]